MAADGSGQGRAVDPVQEADHYERVMRAVDVAAAQGRWTEGQRIAARIEAARQIEAGRL